MIVEHVPMKELVSLKEVRLDDGEEEKILLEKGGTAAKGAVNRPISLRNAFSTNRS